MEEKQTKKNNERYWKLFVILIIIAVGISIVIGVTMAIKVNNKHTEGIYEPPIASFNSKFEAYEGSKIRGSQVKQLCKEASQNNLNNGKKVRIGIVDYQKEDGFFDNTDPDNLVKENGEFGEEYKNLSIESLYNVKCHYDKDSGDLKSITVLLTN